jgi:hypothetical protein
MRIMPLLLLCGALDIPLFSRRLLACDPDRRTVARRRRTTRHCVLPLPEITTSL